MEMYIEILMYLAKMQKYCMVMPLICVLIMSIINLVTGVEVIYAVNAGGEEHVDIHGISYQRDPLHNVVGIPSDYGKQLMIMRVPPQDQILYQTERYSDSTFGYDVPIKKDGKYVLVLKFSEVYFNSPGQKVFDIVMNSQHTIVPELDIFSEVGRGVAHDEYIPFEIKHKKLLVGGDESEYDGTLTIEFIKGYRDNPKVNAIAVMKGELSDIPQLPALPQPDEDMEEPDPSSSQTAASMEDEEEIKSKRSKISSGPKVQDPYSTDESSLMVPVIVAVGAFFPLLFCLCKL